MNGAFQASGIHACKEKLVGIGADGASFNLGKKGGVVALLRQFVPHLIDFHCLPHRLELALLEMQRSCKLVETLYEVLQLIWKTYHYSPKSTHELQTVGSELGVSVLKPTKEWNKVASSYQSGLESDDRTSETGIWPICCGAFTHGPP